MCSQYYFCVIYSTFSHISTVHVVIYEVQLIAYAVPKLEYPVSFILYKVDISLYAELFTLYPVYCYTQYISLYTLYINNIRSSIVSIYAQLSYVLIREEFSDWGRHIAPFRYIIRTSSHIGFTLTTEFCMRTREATNIL